MSAVQRLVLWALGLLERYRYIKFGIVGASGTVVNLAVLHFGHEYLFNHIEAGYNKPYFSLALAIALATLNNFTWNRLWTWSDRVKTLEAGEVQPVSLRLLGYGVRSVRHRLGIRQRHAICADPAAVGQHGLPHRQHHRHRGGQRQQLSGERPLDLQTQA